MARRKRQKRPSRSQRQRGGFQQPTAVELYYEREITALVRKWGLQAIRQLLKKHKPEVATDAISSSDSESLARIGARMAGSSNFVSSLLKVGKKTTEHSYREFKRLGISLDDEPGLTKLIGKWTRLNTKLVTELTRNETGKLVSILEANPGKPVKAMAKLLAERLDISMRKARLVARTETNKLNSQINTERATAAGLTEFIWTTMGDERVSDEHAEMDGEQYEFRSPPTDSAGNTGLPGEIRPNCRCIAYPVVPEFDDKPEKSKGSRGFAQVIRAHRHHRRTGHGQNNALATGL